MELTRAQRRLLKTLAEGGVFYAAVNYPHRILNGGPELSESVKIRVLRRLPEGGWQFAYCVRNKTAYPLWKANYVSCIEGSSGDREFKITDAGRRA